jgi:putative NADH-flavin reductase
MNITLLGATGQTGSVVLQQALNAGYKVTAVARTPTKIAIKHENLTIIGGDATDVNILKKAMSGNNLLISTLGTALAGAKQNDSLITSSTKAIIEAAISTGCARIIMMSSFAVNRSQLTGPAKFITGAIMKKHIIDKSAGEALLRHSNMRWTIVYPTTLTNGSKTTHVHVMPAGEKVGLGNKISRADVAGWILAEASEDHYVNQNVTITG